MPAVVVVALVLGVVLVVVLLAVTYWWAWQLVHPRRTPLYFRPEEYGLAVEEISIPGPRGALRAWYLPARNGCTLICCHGINDNRSQWVPRVARLHASGGYGALMFDFAGHGESDASLVTYGVREAGDVAAVVAYLRSRGDVAMGRLGILGLSLGAITATLAAAGMPELRVVVLESGFADLPHDVGKLFHRFTGAPTFPFAWLIVFWGQRICGIRLAEIHPARVIGQISPRAVLIIADLEDGLADEPYDGEQLYAHAGEPKELWQVAGAAHVKAFETAPEEWIARVGGFLDQYLAAPVGEGAPLGHEAREDA
jgi:pimeloyl-ACP methyl ester carboxylesterase